MAEYIERNAIRDKLYEEDAITMRGVAILNQFPVSDVVSRDCYDRILAENDAMREQLAAIGKKPGDAMDDVAPVVRATWEENEKGILFCTECGGEAYHRSIEYLANNRYVSCTQRKTRHCPHCGAEMVG